LEVFEGASATLNQFGSGLNSASIDRASTGLPSTNPVQVYSTNPGNITITQTNF
jgi:hypothetical protein